MWIALLQHSPEDIAFGFGNSSDEAISALVDAYPQAVGRALDVAEVQPGQGFASQEAMLAKVVCTNRGPSKMSETQARKKFAAYFLDLKASMAAEGGKVEKSAEWERCIEHWIAEGDAPAEATGWKCPRSLEAELKG